NQNIILNSMAGTDEKYFEAFSFTAIETENVEETVNENGETLYNRVDKNQPAIVRYKIVPKSRYTYYFLLPVYFNQTRNQ
ncbi:YfhO family protein, partial [Enterobacter sp. JH586]